MEAGDYCLARDETGAYLPAVYNRLRRGGTHKINWVDGHERGETASVIPLPVCETALAPTIVPGQHDGIAASPAHYQHTDDFWSLGRQHRVYKPATAHSGLEEALAHYASKGFAVRAHPSFARAHRTYTSTHLQDGKRNHVVINHRAGQVLNVTHSEPV